MQIDTSETLEPGGKLGFSRRGGRGLGSERIDLLQAIDQVGSISQAAKCVDLSYKTAWDAVDAMNNLADKPLLISATGGHYGSGSYLTKHGRDIVRMYRLLESGYQQLLMQMQAQVEDFDQLNQLLKAITWKTSARNQFRGSVKTVRAGGVTADVVLDIGDGLDISATVTNEAVEDLRLAHGREAVALIKASFILLALDEQIRVSARNRLAGVVTAVISGGLNSEAKVQLAGGRVLTAIVTREALEQLDLAEGTPCCALVDSSHVLIAVND